MMTIELLAVILVALAISAVSAIVIWRHTRTTESAREVAMRHQREARRFRREPRVGDRAGYVVAEQGMTHVRWMVGQVVEIRDEGGVLLLEEISVGPFGTVVKKKWTYTDQLRWFPPDTPLGLYVENDGAHA